jgi:acyl carrier protein
MKMPENLTEATLAPSTPEELGSWLADRIGYYLERPSNTIGRDTPLSEYGLDSVFAFALCGDLEDLLEIAIDPTLIWDYKTVDALTEHLSGRLVNG